MQMRTRWPQTLIHVPVLAWAGRQRRKLLLHMVISWAVRLEARQIALMMIGRPLIRTLVVDDTSVFGAKTRQQEPEEVPDRVMDPGACFGEVTVPAHQTQGIGTGQHPNLSILVVL